MTAKVDVFLRGVPQPQGSKRHVGGGRMIESNAAKLRPWRAMLTAAVADNIPDGWDQLAPMRVDARFSFNRPSSHYGTGRNQDTVKRSAPQSKTTKPDLDKLVRAVLDACTDAGLWRDDSQVVELFADKTYGSNHLQLTVWDASLTARVEAPRHIQQQKGDR